MTENEITACSLRRRDVLDQFGITAPNTWRELVDVAARFAPGGALAAQSDVTHPLCVELKQSECDFADGRCLRA